MGLIAINPRTVEREGTVEATEEEEEEEEEDEEPEENQDRAPRDFGVRRQGSFVVARFTRNQRSPAPDIPWMTEEFQEHGSNLPRPGTEGTSDRSRSSTPMPPLNAERQPSREGTPTRDIHMVDEPRGESELARRWREYQEEEVREGRMRESSVTPWEGLVRSNPNPIPISSEEDPDPSEDEPEPHYEASEELEPSNFSAGRHAYEPSEYSQGRRSISITPSPVQNILSEIPEHHLRHFTSEDVEQEISQDMREVRSPTEEDVNDWNRKRRLSVKGYLKQFMRKRPRGSSSRNPGDAP